MSAPNLSIRVIKLTPAQKDTFFAHFAHDNYRKNADGIGFRRVMGGAFARMLDKMGTDGLWQRDRLPTGAPNVMRHAPTPLGVRAWLAQDPRVTPELRAKAQDHIAAYEAAETSWNAEVERRRAEDRERGREYAARARVRRIARLRELFAEMEVDPNEGHATNEAASLIHGLCDDALLAFVDKVVDRSEAS